MSEPNDQRTAWIAPLAISIVCCLLLIFLGAYTAIARVLVAIAGFSALVAIGNAIRGRVRLPDRYDLGTLREIHEREELMDLDPGTLDPEADRVVCFYCNHQYHSRFPACPHCGRR